MLLTGDGNEILDRIQAPRISKRSKSWWPRRFCKKKV